jgi:hypothetical protein
MHEIKKIRVKGYVITCINERLGENGSDLQIAFASNRSRPHEKWLTGPTRAAEKESTDLSGSRSP